MTTIPVRVCGDVWCDPDDFNQCLRETDPQQSLLIDLRCEGPSLGALGIRRDLEKYCEESGRDPATIELINAPNNLENTPFHNPNQGISHFFSMSRDYWRPYQAPCELANRFGFFVGRATVARCVMMYEIWHSELKGHFKFSTMRYAGNPIWLPYPGWRVIEKFDDWINSDQQQKLFAWWPESRPPSIDHKSVQDQYTGDSNTNLSLLNHYVFFNIELVAETYTLGDTFFPTEKTVRPISQAKPILVYGPANFLQRLRDLGFETYRDLWDESYDQFEGHQRWIKIKTVIEQICNLPHRDFADLMRSAQTIAWHNRRVLAEIVLTSPYRRPGS